MSAMAAGSDLLEHTRTQLPYAGIAAVASFIGYLVLGFTGASVWVMLAVVLVVMVVLYLVLCKLWGVKLEDSDS